MRYSYSLPFLAVAASMLIAAARGPQTAEASLDRVAELAGCSRIAIYQYVAGKEELFGQLAGQAAAQMWAALESLDDVTADARRTDERGRTGLVCG
mgnify:CR=1 FL=1